jgi:hypothetical protein
LFPQAVDEALVPPLEDEISKELLLDPSLELLVSLEEEPPVLELE